MVLLTTALIEKECARIQSNKSLTKGVSKNHLRKTTHLFMNEKFIEAIGNFSGCKNLRVIYMQNNSISKIENLDFAINLTHLYLQHNAISKIENLHGLRNLKCLHLGYNCINVVQGLESLENLLELHVENQKLSTGESLVFDLRSLRTLSNRLKLLSVAGNKLVSLRPFNHFLSLESIDARDNQIEDVQTLIETVATLPWLRSMFMRGNPVTQCYRYRENFVAHCNSLELLDGKMISDNTRCFMNKFKEAKQLRVEKKGPKLSLSDDITTSMNLPPAFRRSVSRAILQHQPGPKLTISAASVTGETQSQIFQPWKCISAIDGRKDDHLRPRPLWRYKWNPKKPPRCSSKATDKTGLPVISARKNE